MVHELFSGSSVDVCLVLDSTQKFKSQFIVTEFYQSLDIFQLQELLGCFRATRPLILTSETVSVE